MKSSRTRLLALLLVAVFSFAAVGATTIASANDASTSAKKKSKKCKKGYKKVKGKCKKKAASKTSETVASVKLNKIDLSAYGAELFGTITLKKPVTSIVVEAFRVRGVLTPRSSKTTITSDGIATTIEFKVRAPQAPPSERSRAPITHHVVVDGVKSNTLP